MQARDVCTYSKGCFPPFNLRVTVGVGIGKSGLMREDKNSCDSASSAVIWRATTRLRWTRTGGNGYMRNVRLPSAESCKYP